MRRKEEMCKKVGAKHLMIEPDDPQAGPEPNTLWALKDVSFSVQKGEIVGIIGRNGAGKSTLLKILSRITEPTKGRAIMRGRVSSLLEVGTGFHPELTGRENIYLNGAILGMRKAEIDRKFDEIVDFSGVEKFIDTPVKRYSSGMYVRLAFAVAAHLEPEILLVDEVLAVGDFEFQKKCLGKMGDVAKEGRTVLFVSHNMGAINQLCNRAIVLENGQAKFTGSVNESIKEYLKGSVEIKKQYFQGPLSSVLDFQEVFVNGMTGSDIFIPSSSDITLSVTGSSNEDIPSFRVTFAVFKENIRVFTMHDVQHPQLLPKGKFKAEVTIAAFLLRPGEYSLTIGGYKGGGQEWICGSDVIVFGIMEEWSLKNESVNIGIINVPHNGSRKVIK